MNSPDLFAPWLVPLGWLALEAVVVGLAALAAQPLLRTAATRRSLWRAALLALIAVLAAELTGTGSQLPAQLRLARQTTFPTPVPPPEPPPALEELPFLPPPVSSLAPTGGEGRGEGAFPAPEPLQFEPVSPLSPPAPTPSLHPSIPPSPPSPWPAFLWLAGLAALLMRAAWTHAGFAWLRFRHFIPAAETLRQRVQSLAARLGLRRRVRVLASERLHAPAAFGWMRPGVAVPGDFTARFAPVQQDVMLAHELAHLAARDPLWQLLADLAVAALWWHPLAWVARHQHRLAAELAADDASQALPDGPVVLAECLLTLGQEAAAAPRAPLGMAGFRSQLGRRVERLVALPRRDWSAPGPLRLALQTTVALLALAALALLPGCAANRAASEPPSRLLTKWWQAKSKTPENQPRGATLLIRPQPKPVIVEGRVSFNGPPPIDHTVNERMLSVVAARLQEVEQARKQKAAAIELAGTEYKRLVESATAPNLEIPERNQRKQAAELKLRDLQHLETSLLESDRAIRLLTQERFRAQADAARSRQLRISGGSGLADVLVYVKEGLTNQTFTAPTNPHVIRIQDYEYQPYITAVQTGQPIRWETDVNLNFHPTPTNPANREFNRTLDPGRPVEASFTAPEFFLRTKDDVHPWLFGYVSILPHPFFAVTDAEGRFRFPQPLPPGKYTLAAVHRRAGEVVQELNLTVPLPTGAPVPSVEFQFNASPGSAAPPPLVSTPQLPAPPLAADFQPSKPPTREELLERKARLEADIKAMEKVFRPTHPKMVGLRKQLESVEEALKEAHGVKDQLEAVRLRLARLESIENKLRNPDLSPDERLALSESATSWVPSSIPAPSSPPSVDERLQEAERRRRLLKVSLQKQLSSLSNAVTAVVGPQTQFNLSPPPAVSASNGLDISVGRQLFVDDFLIANSTLKRTWHLPVLAAELPQESARAEAPLRGVFPFPEAVWYDAASQLFKMRFALRTNSVHLSSPSGTNWGLGQIHLLAEPVRLQAPPVLVRTQYESLTASLRKPEWDNQGIILGFERNGSSVETRVPRDFIPLPTPADGSRWSDLHPMTNGFLVVGRNLYFYFGGRVQAMGETHPNPAVGLATLRRDGFASLDAGPEGGVLTTKPVTFTGRFLFVNLKTNAPDGELRIEILHPDGRPITVTKNDTQQQTQPFSLANTIPLAADQTLMGVSWQNGMQDLSMLANRPVRFRFHLKNASLYSFWVSPGQLGRSMGRVAGGGPHFTNDVDTIGNRSYRPFPVVSTNAPAPKPGGASAPPAPVGDDVRRLTSTRNAEPGTQNEQVSQRLVTSSPTPVQLAAASPKGVTLPVPNPYYKTNSQPPFLTHSSKGAQRINRKLEEIVLPEVHFDAVPLVGVVQRLIEDAKKFDPEPDPAKKGLNFLINDVAPAAPLLDAAGNPVPVARPVALSEGLVRVTQPLKNLTLRQALDVICKTAELPTQFSVEEYAIAFIPRGPVAYYSRMFRVNPDTFIQGLQGVVATPVLGVTPGGGNAPGAVGQNQPTTTTPAAPVRATVPATVPATQRTTTDANALVRQFFQSAGVTALGATNGSTRVTFNPENGLLLVRGTTNELRLIEQAIQKVQPTTPTTNAAPNRLPTPNSYYRTNTVPVHSGKGAQLINRKLDEIILPEVRFDSVTLPEVVKWLDANVRKLDPEKKGLNLLINNFVAPVPIGPVSPVLDPKGNPIVASPRPAVTMQPDLAGALVNLPVALTNLTLRQALDVICKATVIKPVEGRGQGLKYSVEDYAIVFSPKLPEQADLFSRIFKVEMETFLKGLGSVVDEKELRPGSRTALNHALRERAWTNAPVGTNRFSVTGIPVAQGGTGVVNTNVTSELNRLVRLYFTAAGVANLGATNGPDATQVFFNDRNGLLLVRASLEDLNIIQQAVELLNVKPKRVKFDVTAFETGPTTERLGVSMRVVTAEEARTITKRFMPTASRQSDLVVIVPMFESARIPLFGQGNTNGPSLHVLPILEREQQLQITVLTDHVSLPRRFSGVNMNAREIYDYVHVPGQTPPRPAMREDVKQPVSIVSVPFGHVVVVSANTAATGAPSGSAPNAGFTILLTPTLVDPAGNSINTTSDEMPFAPAGPSQIKPSAQEKK